jgi:hypothetical protein
MQAGARSVSQPPTPTDMATAGDAASITERSLGRNNLGHFPNQNVDAWGAYRPHGKRLAAPQFLLELGRWRWTFLEGQNAKKSTAADPASHARLSGPFEARRHIAAPPRNRHPQIARRAKLPQLAALAISVNRKHSLFVLLRQEGRIAIVTTREAGCGGREGAD